jgi:peptidoglycan/LPS O-acetylase OafA/YrhL
MTIATLYKSLSIADNPATTKRFKLIDGLRGLAALAVTGFHFYAASPLLKPLSAIFPVPLQVLLTEGKLGVETFFVLSGFVIAYSLRKTPMTRKNLQQFVSRFLVRICPPYWVTIVLTLLLSYLSNLFLTDRLAPMPSVAGLAAHLVFLQGLLNFDQIVPVFWTLSMEIQFYLFFALQMTIVHWLCCRKLVQASATPLLFAPFTLLSMYLFFNSPYTQTFFLPYWHMFAMGALLCWMSESKAKSYWFWFYSVLNVAYLITSQDWRTLVMLGTGALIYLAVSRGKLYHWLNLGWLQYIGKISYSLYLLHLVIGMRIVNLGYRFVGTSPLLALIVFLLAIGGSILFAHLMYAVVERPSVAFSHRFRSVGAAQP